ncbi:MAG: hypothetical protein JNM80_09125 [Phycisphaerae bacterium]|nr:hypothetical protein [Phycisphaerae bacterium]
MTTNDFAHSDALVSADAQALDRLLAAGLSPDPADARAHRLASLLSLLDSTAKASPTLVDVTMTRVLRAAESHGPRLHHLDDEALDAWVMAGGDPAAVPASLRERAHRHDALARLVTTTGDADHHALAALADRTLARVQAEIDRRESALDLDQIRRRRTGIRLSDLLSVAAVVLLGMSVALPVLSAVREQGRRALCLGNLGTTAAALSAYAHANRDSMPVAAASMGGNDWWSVGRGIDRSNSANLFALSRAGYVPLSSLACPGNPLAPTAPASADATDWRRLEEVSYSYQIMFGPTRPTWQDPANAVVLADRSPVVLRAVAGHAVNPLENAPNHLSAGQHVLRTDASAAWASSPVLKNGDNIWLPRAIEIRLDFGSGRNRPATSLRGNELPSAADDTFLGP